MEATRKIKLLKAAIVLVLAVWLLSPEISLVTEGDDGLDFSIGCESVFTVGDTSEDAVRSNLDSCIDEGAVRVYFGNTERALTEGDTRAVASEIIGSGASTYTAVDDTESTVTIRAVDMSTASETISMVRIDTTQRFIDSISPTLTVSFSLGDSEVSVPTDSRIESADGNMDIYVQLPVGLYDIARDLGCELVLGIDIRYMGLMDASVDVGLDETEAENASVSVAGSVCTISFDPDCEDIVSQVSGLSGALICGSAVTASAASISFDIGDSGSLSGFLSSCLEQDGALTILDGDRTVALDGEEAEGIIDIVRILEASS